MACQQPEKNQKREITLNNDGLDEQDGTTEKYEIIRLASIFGGTSIY